MSDYLMHYGTPRHSGRYPWGSGEHPYQRYGDFYSRYNRLKSQGLTEKQMAEQLGVVDKFGNPSVRMLRARYSNATAEKRAADRATVLKYKEEGLNNSEIGRKMGINESSVRSLLDEAKAQRKSLNQQTADVLKKYVEENRYVDIGPGVEYELGVKRNRVENAVDLLMEDGYKKQFVQIDQMGTDHKTTITVLTPPDVSYSELSEHRYDIHFPGQESVVVDENGEIGMLGLKKPKSVDSDRIMIRYNEEGGIDKDGLIELRRGVDDISLGASQYAQVRIAVDDSKYLKGMAAYSDDIPDGVDIIFNTNKHLGTDKTAVLKSMETDKNGNINWDNPFGSSVTQLNYTDSKGNEQLSTINIVRKEGEWKDYKDSLASQFLSKQPIPLAERQLNQSYNDKKLEFEEICALTNPTVKKKLLISFADNCDSAAVDLKAAPFAGQQTHVILPFTDIKDNEIYAPNYANGTRVALVRYPHGGTFEIPELTVNNKKGSSADKTIHNAPDAVGINSHVASRLSGADFDGDTVVVIPLSDKVRVRTKPALEGLKDFDPKEAYPGYDGMKVISSQAKQTEMGKVSNLITDMTLKGASDDEIARAVRHSMVVIDAEKHKLNYRQSEIDNGIAELKKKYQDNGDGHTGASTIISRASSEMDVEKRKDWSPSSKSIAPDGSIIFDHPKDNTYQTAKLNGETTRVNKDRKTGELYLLKTDEETGKRKRVPITEDEAEKIKERNKEATREVSVYTDKKTGQMYYLNDDPATGKKVRVDVDENTFKGDIKTNIRTQKSTKMYETDDAFELTSGGSKENPGYPIEKVYAQYANDMKALGNAARAEWLRTENLKYSPDAAKEYAAERASLDNKLALAKSNSPKERHAQLIANQVMAIKKQANPGMDKDEIKKYKGQALMAAREKVHAEESKKGKNLIDISDKEWAAIQAGAISHSKLTQILDNADLDKLKERATPRSRKTITPSMQSLAKSMNSSGYTTAQIADRLGISPSSVYSIVNPSA